MTLAHLELADLDKLDTLRRLDQFREWQSLDERRYCLVCGNLINGWEIQVIANSSDTRSLQVVCPTEHCPSIPMDWVIPTEEILATLSTRKRDQLPPAES
jgi:hypothetical protein